MVTAGATMSAARREALIAISRAHNLLIMADEVYHLLDFGDAPPRPLAAYAHDARVLSFGSFSKICAPGLRLGWIHSAPDLLGALMTSGLVQSGGRLNPFTSGVVRSLLDLGLADTTLDALRAVYTERSAVLCRALPEQVSTAMFVEPRGGYFVWTELPNDMHAAARLPRAKSEGDTFHPGGRFISRDGFAPAMRLSFAHYDAPTLVEGVERLARAMEGYGRAV